VITNHFLKVFVFASAVLLLTTVALAQHHSSLQSIPAGTPINVRINEKLSSETSHPGDSFTGILTQSLAVNGAVFPRGTQVSGEVVNTHKSGRLSDPGVLELALVSIGSGSQRTNVSSELFVIKGESHTKNNVTKIGGGTAVGAIIGGLADGGKGAAIGAGVGAGAGTGVAAATGKKPALVEPEAILVFVSGGPASSSNRQRAPVRNDYRNRDDYPDNEVHRKHSHHDDDDDDDGDRDDRGRDDRGRYREHEGGYSFGDRDREVLVSCLSGYQFESLPPGIQKKLERGGTLPPGQAKKLHALPGSCTTRMSPAPRAVTRIIFGDRVILLSSDNRILDIFIFER